MKKTNFIIGFTNVYTLFFCQITNVDPNSNDYL